MWYYSTLYLKSGLLISKYRVSPTLYRRYFFSIGESIANTFEKSIGRDIANTILAKKIDTFYRYLFPYNIGFNGLPQFATVERLFTFEGKIFAPFFTHLGSRNFEIVMLFHASK